MSDHIDRTIEQAQAKLREYEEKVRDTKKLINQLRSFAGQPPLYPDAEPVSSGTNPLRGDEYYGKAQSTACREVLDRRKAANLGPASLDEIYAELTEGGYKFAARDAAIAKRSLQQMLQKNTAIFHRVPNGRFGLLSWYPNVKPPKARPDEEQQENETDDEPPINPNDEQVEKDTELEDIPEEDPHQPPTEPPPPQPPTQMPSALRLKFKR